MEKNKVVGGVQIAGGSYLAYQGLKHGLPRAAGIRVEYHTTSKNNAKLIKEAGNYLDPSFGGKSGWGERIGSRAYVENSKNYVHITGIHTDHLKNYPRLKYYRSLFRKAQGVMYRFVGNMEAKSIKSLLNGDFNKKRTVSTLLKEFGKLAFKNRTKTFAVPGTDSYFNKNFIPDSDDFALKSTEKVKVYNNRFSAMIGGLKKFGLKGMKENKGRVAVGFSILAMGAYAATKLFQAGINNLKTKDN